MATYATAEQVTALIPGLTIDDPAAFEATLQRAERDVDGVLGAIRPRDDTGLKLAPAELLQWERDALAAVVAAQVEWLLSNPRAGMDRPVQSVSGPDFSQTYANGGSGLIGPRVATELRRINHLRVLTATARP